MRKKYYPALNFTIVVDLGARIFNAELLTRGPIDQAAQEKGGEKARAERDNRAKELREKMAAIDQKLDELQRQREELIEEKERTMDEVGQLMAVLPNYQVRRIMYEFISRPDLDPEELAKALSIRDEVVLRYLKEWLGG